MENQNPNPNPNPTPAPENAPQGQGISIAALVCGVIGVGGLFIHSDNSSVSLFLAIAVFVCAILGIVFGAKGMKIAKETGRGKGLAVAGLVCGIVGTACAGIAILCVACVACGLAAALS